MNEFEDIYRTNAEAIFRFVQRSVGRRDIAEEITGDVFVTLFENFEQTEKDQVVAWLYTVARNRATDYWRKRVVEQRHAQTVASDPVTSQPEIEDLFDNKALKPVHRVCLTLRYVYGMDRPEIARYTGLTDNQVKSCLQYARHLLRGQLLKEPG